MQKALLGFRVWGLLSLQSQQFNTVFLAGQGCVRLEFPGRTPWPSDERQSEQ